MSQQFFERPILNSPYEYPSRHWELDASGQPTDRILDRRRQVAFISPIPRPKKQKELQHTIVYDEAARALESDDEQYDLTAFISNVRHRVDRWRELPDPASWRVTPETARLLQHWRSHRFGDIRPFFCQVEAVETAIWLTEVAPQLGREERKVLDDLQAASERANPGLARLALKLATGAGKTTVMAMLIAWQTVNAARRPGSRKFTRGFLVVAPGITIRDRLRVLHPNDPDAYYASRELVPADMLRDLERAKIVITNYHAFLRRETLELSKGGRALLRGQGPDLRTKETEGQMLQRVMPELMAMKRILALNDEAHHCYRERPPDDDEEGPLKGDDRKEADKNREAARVWISGLEAVQRKLGLQRVIDLSATPFFLSGSGYREGVLFPWTTSDFSLMDAIECGIVKLPRVPVADNVPGGEMPKFRNLWEHIRPKMPKRGRGKAGRLDPLSLPVELHTALEALYGHYEKTFELWAKAGIEVPPCFIVVCNNTSTSKLVYDYISGFHRENEDGSSARGDALARRVHLRRGTLRRRPRQRGAGEARRHLRRSGVRYGFAPRPRGRGSRGRRRRLRRTDCLRVQLRGPRLRVRSPRPHPRPQGAHERRPPHGGRAEEHRQGQLVRRLRRARHRHPAGDGDGAGDGQLQVKINGVDVFHPNTGEVRSDGADSIACWFIDTDYNEESFFVRHAYFLGANDPYKALKTTLKAEIDPDAWATLRSDISRPFDRPESGRIAVKVINHLGDEVMKVFRV